MSDPHAATLALLKSNRSAEAGAEFRLAIDSHYFVRVDKEFSYLA